MDCHSCQERVQLVTNTLHQISLWGPTGEIVDYAIKQWSGVFSNYLQGRWELFADKLEESLVSGTPFDQQLFNFNVLMMVEKPFANDVNTSFPTQPKGEWGLMADSFDLIVQLGFVSIV